MFLKSLIIQNGNEIIREINFHKGVNFIVDETPETQTKSQQKTGNNVGKTTVLRLVDYCFGKDGNNIYRDTEFNKHPNSKIEKFLKNNNVIVSVILSENIDDENCNKICIKRNFLTNKKKTQEINGEAILNDKKFGIQLKKLIFNSETELPTFRQIVSKNIRYEGNSTTNIVKVLHGAVSSDVYEAMYLFWMGLDIDDFAEKKQLINDEKIENQIQKRLEQGVGNLSLIEQELGFVNGKIEKLNKQKETFNINENYSEDIDKLNETKYKLNKLSTEVSKLEMRRDLILESKEDLEKEYTQIDSSQIKLLYEKAQALIPNVQVSFEDTIKFHNDLISEKLKYITKELPELQKSISTTISTIRNFRELEKEQTENLQKKGITEELEVIVVGLNSQFERKGKLEEQKRIWLESQNNLEEINNKLNDINNIIASNDTLINNRVTEFNKYFPVISKRLYGDEYLLSAPKNKKGFYELDATNIGENPGTGKKKGQIAAFDFAYIKFADSLNIRCLHFIMHDQIENIDDNQLNTLFEVANGNNINCQYIVPILRDKIPSNIDVSMFEVLSLSQDDKLFKV
jgi:uncharacterized protein YydD (DUF2326 family)